MGSGWLRCLPGLVLVAGCAANVSPPGSTAPDLTPTPPELDLLLIPGGEGESATFLVEESGEVALIDGGPLGAPLAVLLDLCRRWRACEPDHVVVTPAARRGSPGLLFLLAGRDRQPGTDDDLRPVGAGLEIDPGRSCESLACLALRDLLGSERAARDRDLLMLGEAHRLQLSLSRTPPRLELQAHPSGATLGAILWGPAPCSLPPESGTWAFADLTRCPAGSLSLAEANPAPARVFLQGGAGRCEDLERDLRLLEPTAATVFVLGGGECSRAAGVIDVGAHLILRLADGHWRPLLLGPEGRPVPLPIPSKGSRQTRTRG